MEEDKKKGWALAEAKENWPSLALAKYGSAKADFYLEFVFHQLKLVAIEMKLVASPNSACSQQQHAFTAAEESGDASSHQCCQRGGQQGSWAEAG